ncbi:MAG: Asp-tRNA(Asn)/Glu-tRNA(Gln) amidotransferase subunit GatC [Dehalococcoidia bacterium]|nr:Asp-tRNA(Asn)/Glu-tRNA(Gln) amidotransferase subunit GatC [Dehalococcoidia bacterium]
MKLTREEVQHISQLCRVGVTEKDIARFQEQLSAILEAFEVLKEVDTASVPPTAHALALQNVLRDDTVTESLSREDVLANAPQEEMGCFRVRAILEE